MKKSLLFAVLAMLASSAFGQGYYMDFTPAMGSELNSLTTTVVATLTDEAKAAAPKAAAALVQAIGGDGFSQEISEPFPVSLAGDSISIPLTKEMWSLPFNEVYHLQLLVVLTDATGTPIEDDETMDYVMDMTAYTCADTAPAAWAKNYPNERNWEEEGLTFSRFYNIGECYFYFTKDVEVPSQAGYIVYTDINGVEKEVDIEDYSASWDEGLGLYAVAVNIKSDAYTAASLQSVEVVLEGVEDADGQELDVPSILAVNSATPKTAPRKVKNLENGLTAGNESVNIYNVQGILVKENVSVNAINELPAGLYIVNGKKVVVR